MALNLRIRELREAKGWTLEVLASRIGVSVPHLSGVERGVKNLNNHLIERLSTELDVEPYLLFSAEQRIQDVLGILSDLDATDLAKVEGFASALRSTR